MVAYLFALGLCFMICLTVTGGLLILGRTFTLKPRLEHERQMVIINEQKKMNAIEIEERQAQVFNKVLEARHG